MIHDAQTIVRGHCLRVVVLRVAIGTLLVLLMLRWLWLTLVGLTRHHAGDVLLGPALVANNLDGPITERR